MKTYVLLEPTYYVSFTIYYLDPMQEDPDHCPHLHVARHLVELSYTKDGVKPVKICVVKRGVK